LIFENNGFPPLHKRIYKNGEMVDLENFQFSIMYELQIDKIKEEMKMKKANKETANVILDKGLANKYEPWINKYL